MNNNLKELFRKKAYWKKRKEEYSSQFFRSSILPWIIIGIATVVFIIWDKTVFRDYIYICLAIGTTAWGIYWQSKITQCSRKLELIDKKIAEELTKDKL